MDELPNQDKDQNTLFNKIEYDEFILNFKNPSSEVLIPRKKKLYESHVATLVKATIEIFECKIDKKYDQQLIECVVNKVVSLGRENIKNEMLSIDFSILDNILNGNLTKINLRLTLPKVLFIPSPDKVWYMSKLESIDYEFEGPTLLACRDFYRIHYLEKIPIDYREVPIFGSNLGWPTETFNKWVFASTIIEYFQWIKEQHHLSLENSEALKGNTTKWKNKKNIFNEMPVEEVFEYFKKLTNRRSKVNAPFLTEENLSAFIDKAFCGCNINTKVNFSYGAGEKGLIINFFYQYFNHCRTRLGISTTKEKYVNLLTNHFNGFDYKSTFANFSKPHKNPII